MRLTHVEVQDYRAFHQAAFDIPENGLVVVVGPNNAGKSALLSALDVVAGLPVEGPWRNAYAGAAPTWIIADFALTDDERSAATPDTSISRWQDKDALRILTVTFGDVGGQLAVVKLSTLARGAGRDIAVVSGGWTNMTDVQQGLVADDWSMPNKTGNAMALSDPRSWNPGLREGFLAWRERYFHFRSLRPGTARSRPSSDIQRLLAATGENLPEVLAYLRSHDDPAWPELQAVLADILPEAGELQAPLEAGTVQAVFRESAEVAHNIKDLGTGVEQIAMLACVGSTQPENSIVLVEEPEANLHPAAQRKLASYLRQWSAKRTFIIATHSPVLMDRASVDEPVLLVSRHNRDSMVARADACLPDVLAELGVRRSDILGVETLLVAEGPSDADIIRAWYPSTRGDVTIVESPIGSDAAWRTDWVDDLLGAADDLGKQRLVFLRDGDELPPKTRAKLEQKGLVRVLSVREIENLLLDPVHILGWLDQRRGTPAPEGAPTTPEEVAAFLDAAADQLKPLVVLKRVVARLPRLQLAPRAALKAISPPTLEALLEVVEAQLPGPELRRDVAVMWQEETMAVEAAWGAEKLRLAPGEELLGALWQAHGLRYNKLTDGPAIAAMMGGAPPAAASLLDDILRPEAQT